MKTINFLILVFSPLFLNAQFSERIITEKSSSIATYDTTENFKHSKKLIDYKMYIGQEFYILPSNFKPYVSEDELKRFKNVRYKTPRPYYREEQVKKKIKKTIAYKVFYKSDIDDTYTPYDSIGGKTFKVLDFDETKSNIITDGYNQLCFTLLEEKSKDTLIWTPAIYVFEYPYSIAIVSYLNKIKDKYIGKELLSRADMVGTSEKPYFPPYFGHLININNGEAVKIAELDRWKCTDLAIIGVYSNSFKQPMLILKNTKGEEISIFFLNEGTKRPSRPALNLDFITNSEYLEYCKLFGNEYGKLIVLNKVKIGMTSKMCIISWGKPKEVNTTTGSFGVHEQWVYESGSYLYFENDILTTIQN